MSTAVCSLIYTCLASSAMAYSPLSTANATLALNADVWFFLVILLMLAPSIGPFGPDHEARFSLNLLSEFPGLALPTPLPRLPNRRATIAW